VMATMEPNQIAALADLTIFAKATIPRLIRRHGRRALSYLHASVHICKITDVEQGARTWASANAVWLLN
jgi:hypothetical protein